MSLDVQDSPLVCGQEKSRLQHLESCTVVWVGKTLPFFVGRRNVASIICSHALV